MITIIIKNEGHVDTEIVTSGTVMIKGFDFLSGGDGKYTTEDNVELTGTFRPSIIKEDKT